MNCSIRFLNFDFIIFVVGESGSRIYVVIKKMFVTLEIFLTNVVYKTLLEAKLF